MDGVDLQRRIAALVAQSDSAPAEPLCAEALALYGDILSIQGVPDPANTLDVLPLSFDARSLYRAWHEAAETLLGSAQNSPDARALKAAVEEVSELLAEDQAVESEKPATTQHTASRDQ